MRNEVPRSSLLQKPVASAAEGSGFEICDALDSLLNPGLKANLARNFCHANPSRWELDKLGMGNEYVLKFAQALDTSTGYLLGETDDPTRADASLAPQKTADMPQTQAGQDLDALIKELASKNPDLIIRLRSTAQSLDELSDDAKQAIADGLKYVLGLAELDDLPRLKKDSGRGLI